MRWRRAVIGVALIQALLVGVIMIVAGIPAVGIFFILALILGIAQIPVILVTAPAIALMWSLGDHGTAMNIVYTILLIVAGMADNVLKPLMLGRGVDAPMPVVLLGALGGMAASGILGMFIGATLLSIGYRIFMSWVNDGQVGDSQTPVVPGRQRCSMSTVPGASCSPLAPGLVLTACTTLGPDYHPPKTPELSHWQPATQRMASRSTPADYARWWTQLNDPTLTALINEALRKNPDVKIAGLRLLESRAQLGIAESLLGPQATIGSGDLLRTGPATFGKL